MNTIVVNFCYLKYWNKIYKYRSSTPTYKLFLRRIESDKIFKRNVNLYIELNMSDNQRQILLENTANFSYSRY